MVAGHDLGADHQVEFVDQPMGQQVGPQGPAAEDQGVPVVLAQPRHGLVTVRTPDDRRLVAPRPGVVCGQRVRDHGDGDALGVPLGDVVVKG
jgi:hypothetical protein